MSIVFHHVPKTGGTSVMTACTRALGGSVQRASFGDEVKNGLVYIEKHGNPKFVSSHYAFINAMGYEKREGDFFFTWLRDPVDVFWSGCRFYRMKGKPCLHYWPMIVRWQIEEYLHQVEHISDYVDMLLEDHAKKVTDRKFDRDSIFPVRWFADDWNRYDFIGFTERMDVDLQRLSERIGVKVNNERVNVTQDRMREMRAQDVDIDTQYRRQELNKLFGRELRSYRKAMAIMEEKLG